jgi:hypothetical protein
MKKILAICCLLPGIYVSQAQDVKTKNPDKMILADPSAPSTKVTLASSELSTEVKLMSPDNKVISENVNKSPVGDQKTDPKLVKPVSQEHLDKKKRIK